MTKDDNSVLIAWVFSLMLMIAGIVLIVRETSFTLFLGVYLLIWGSGIAERITKALKGELK
jgi:hypothetical protein